MGATFPPHPTAAAGPGGGDGRGNRGPRLLQAVQRGPRGRRGVRAHRAVLRHREHAPAQGPSALCVVVSSDVSLSMEWLVGPRTDLAGLSYHCPSLFIAMFAASSAIFLVILQTQNPSYTLNPHFPFNTANPQLITTPLGLTPPTQQGVWPLHLPGINIRRTITCIFFPKDQRNPMPPEA